MEDYYRPSYWSGNVWPRGKPTPSKVRSSKVVSIPVHFVGSDEQDTRLGASTSQAARPPETAAMRIQKAARGFLVRKNTKAVRRLEADVEAVEKSVKGSEDRLRTDAKERIRVGETLMSILFRLDSVRGVRDYRRRVIRRAIALQEAVDAISAAHDETETNGNAPSESPEDASDEIKSCESGAAPLVSAEDHGASTSRCESKEKDKSVVEEDTEATTEDPDVFRTATNDGLDSGEMSQDRLEDSSVDAIETEEASAKRSTVDEGAPGLPTVVNEPEIGGQGPATNVMETMVEENRALRGLVEELCEKNEVQFRLMSGLLERVERLERAVEKMGRPRKRHACDMKKARARKCERTW